MMSEAELRLTGSTSSKTMMSEAEPRLRGSTSSKTMMSEAEPGQKWSLSLRGSEQWEAGHLDLPATEVA